MRHAFETQDSATRERLIREARERENMKTLEYLHRVSIEHARSSGMIQHANDCVFWRSTEIEKRCNCVFENRLRNFAYVLQSLAESLQEALSRKESVKGAPEGETSKEPS